MDSLSTLSSLIVFFKPSISISFSSISRNNVFLRFDIFRLFSAVIRLSFCCKRTCYLSTKYPIQNFQKKRKVSFTLRITGLNFGLKTDNKSQNCKSSIILANSFLLIITLNAECSANHIKIYKNKTFRSL